MDFLNIQYETVEEFEIIAQILFDKYVIQTHDTLYRLTEIEFYWNSKTHTDNSTYNRSYVDPDTGEWFFHFSGVDIALRNKDTGGHGGILIRKIYDIENNKPVNGPMVCAMKLFSGFNAFNSYIKTQIIPHEFCKSNIIKKARFGLGQNAKGNGADKLNYAFIIDPTSK